jgi:hypothetical protein
MLGAIEFLLKALNPDASPDPINLSLIVFGNIAVLFRFCLFLDSSFLLSWL